jgi:hypothetical protein
MVSEKPAISGLLTDQATAPEGQGDPLRVVVQVVLVLYLSPVILLVAAMGVTAILVDRLVKMASKVIAILPFGKDRSKRQGFVTRETRIGSRPIAGWTRKRSRVIR